MAKPKTQRGRSRGHVIAHPTAARIGTLQGSRAQERDAVEVRMILCPGVVYERSRDAHRHRARMLGVSRTQNRSSPRQNAHEAHRILHIVAQRNHLVRGGTMLARELMTASPLHVTPDDRLGVAAELMRDLDVGRSTRHAGRRFARPFAVPFLSHEDRSMKTDTQIQKDVIDELRWDPSIRDAEIAIAAKDGVVTLSGVVDSFAEKYAAEHAAQRVSGVKAIAEDVTVRLVPTSIRTDADIAHAAAKALKWDIQVPDEKVKVKVEDGYITLSGDVEWKFQQDAAERAVRYLTGAKGLFDLIKVLPKRVSKLEVSGKIKDALRRNAERDADRITVEAADGRVTLKGTVRSFAERSDAERAAWSAPGVTSVDDRIAIG